MVAENLRPGPFLLFSCFKDCSLHFVPQTEKARGRGRWDNFSNFKSFGVLLQSNSFISSISMAMILTAAFVSLQLKGAEFIKNHFAEKGIAENVDMDISKN